MAIKASPETIREMKKNLSNTVKELQKTNELISSGTSKALESWNDDKARHFQQIMDQIKKLTESPIETMNNAQPKLEKLAMALDDYLRIKF